MVILGLYWGYTRIMEEKMETTILGLYRVLGLGSMRFKTLGFRALGCRGFGCRDSGLKTKDAKS